jgi:hypothetical protein
MNFNFEQNPQTKDVLNLLAEKFPNPKKVLTNLAFVTCGLLAMPNNAAAQFSKDYLEENKAQNIGNHTTENNQSGTSEGLGDYLVTFPSSHDLETDLRNSKLQYSILQHFGGEEAFEKWLQENNLNGKRDYIYISENEECSVQVSKKNEKSGEFYVIFIAKSYRDNDKRSTHHNITKEQAIKDGLTVINFYKDGPEKKGDIWINKDCKTYRGFEEAVPVRCTEGIALHWSLKFNIPLETCRGYIGQISYVIGGKIRLK